MLANLVIFSTEIVYLRILINLIVIIVTCLCMLIKMN